MASDQDIYREWLRQQLDIKGRGAKKALAEYMGFVRPDAITRLLNTDPTKETRQIKAVELAKMADFFKTQPPNLTNADHQAGDADTEDWKKRLSAVKSAYDEMPEPFRKRFLAHALGLEAPEQTPASGPAVPTKDGK